MVEATLSKVGNSMAVILPKNLRNAACLESNEPLRLESPRRGVIVITALCEEDEDRIERLDDAESRIKARKKRVRPWSDSASADDILKAGKDARAHELASV